MEANGEHTQGIESPLPWDVLNSRNLPEFIKQLDDMAEEKSPTEYYWRTFLIKSFSLNSKLLGRGKYPGAISV